MRYRSLESILPLLKITSGRPDIDQFLPELAQMVGMVETNLGLSENALHGKNAINLPVERGQAMLPVGFFKENQILDLCLDPRLFDMTCCQCRCSPCHCGYTFIHEQGGYFSFHDNVVDCPYKTGTISFSYWSLEMDREGLPMVMEDHVEAYMAYVNTMFKLGEMNSGQIGGNVYQINKQNWESQSLYTRSRDNVPKFLNVKLAADVTSSPFKFVLR